jgi:predicted DNA binding CopG/RHH family protein
VVTKRSGSSARGKRHAKREKPMPDKKLDFSDIPELSDKQLKKARRVGRPHSENPKQMIALRIAPKLLAQLKRMAKKRSLPYQTLMHQLLEESARRSRR